MKNTVKINEVDCYIANAQATKYATDDSVQHQILVNNVPLGRLNKPADLDRSLRVVLEKPISADFVELFKKCIDLKYNMYSEQCTSVEDYKKAEALNKPIKEKLNHLFMKMWEIENLDLTFIKFKEILDY